MKILILILVVPLEDIGHVHVFGGFLQETLEFESFMLPEENNIAFPGHVTEDSLGVSQVAIDVDSALEAVEGILHFLHVVGM